MSIGMKTTPVKLVLQPGTQLVEVAGVDVTSYTKAVVFEARDGDTPHLGLELAQPALEFIGDAIVIAEVPTEGDPKEEILRFLDSLDPDTLENAALDQHDPGITTGVAFIMALKAMLD